MKASDLFGTAKSQPEATRAELGQPAVTGMELIGAQAAKVEMFAAEIRDLCRLVTDQPLTSAAEAHAVTEMLSRGKIAEKELAASQKAVLAPIAQQEKLIRGVYKPLLTALDNVEARGKAALLSWQQQEAAREQREKLESRLAVEDAARREGEALAAAESATTPQARAEALEAAEEASHEQARVTIYTPPVPKGYRGDSGASYGTKRWTFEVVKPEDVPREFLEVDTKAIRAAVAVGVRQIPGVSIYQADGITVKVG
jgi:hypothetical protein